MVYPSRLGRMFAVVALGFFSMSVVAQAQVFTGPTRVSNNADPSWIPQVAGDAAGNIYAVWQDETSSNFNVLFASSIDGFSTSKNLSNSTGFSFTPRIMVDSQGGINVVWADNTPGYQAVFFSRSTDSGANFSTPKNLSNGPGNAGNPQLAVDASGHISVVWENDSSTLGVFYTNSVDGGATFSTPVNLTSNTTGSHDPQLALDGSGNVYVVWEDDFNSQSDISFSRSVDQGVSFSTAQNLSSNTGSSTTAQLAVDASGNVSVAWADNTPGTFNIFSTHSTDKGATFSAAKNLSNSSGISAHPHISADAGGNVYAVWQGTVPPSLSRDIFLARSTNGGATFAAPQNLANAFGSTPLPWLTVDAAGNVNISWTDTTQGNPQIFFTQSTNHGVTFSATQNLSKDAGFASAVEMSGDGKGNLDVIWTDDALGPNQIFVSQLPGSKKANQPPVANAGADQTVDCTGQGCGSAKLDGSQSSDPDGDTLKFAWQDELKNSVGSSAVSLVTVPMGTHTFTLTVTDSAGLSATAVTHVTVRDTKGPSLQVSLSPNAIRPRDNRLVRVNATVKVSDTCDPNPAVKLVSITSNDPAERGRRKVNDVQAVGGGAVPLGTDVRSFLLRAEDTEHGKDLVYTITYSSTNAWGNTTTATAQVVVARHSSSGSHNGSQNDEEDKGVRGNRKRSRR